MELKHPVTIPIALELCIVLVLVLSFGLGVGIYHYYHYVLEGRVALFIADDDEDTNDDE
jgi:hypothetical protein